MSIRGPQLTVYVGTPFGPKSVRPHPGALHRSAHARRDAADAIQDGRVLPPTVTWPVTPAVVQRSFAAPAGEFGPGHRGLDLAATPGERVLAALPGVVAFVGSVGGVPVVSLDHPGGLRTTYQPVASDLKVGAQVFEGARIGMVAIGAGHCGGTPGCLHWGLISTAGYADPAGLFGRVVLLPVDQTPSEAVYPAQIRPGAVPADTGLPRVMVPLGSLISIGGLGVIGVRRLRSRRP